MIRMLFANHSHTITLTNPVVDYGGTFDHVVHAPGPTLGPNGVNDYLEVDQTLGSVFSLGELPLQVWTMPETPDQFVIVASKPVEILGFNPFQDTSWMYWIGPDSWPAPGTKGWTTGTVQSVTFLWGPLRIGVAPQIGDNIILELGFYDHQT
jgi:hypothetical protein